MLRQAFTTSIAKINITHKFLKQMQLIKIYLDHSEWYRQNSPQHIEEIDKLLQKDCRCTRYQRLKATIKIYFK